MKHFIFIVLLITLLSCTKNQTPIDSKNEFEVRGTWITNVDSDVLLSRESIAEAMEFLADHNFNLVCPVVWNKGVPLFKSEVMNQSFGITILPFEETF